MNNLQVIYQMGSEIIDTRNVDHSNLIIALQYAQFLSNQYGKEINVKVIEQKVQSFSYKPTNSGKNNSNGVYKPPRTDDSPSVCELLNRGD